MIEDGYSTYLCTNAFAFKLVYRKSEKVYFILLFIYLEWF